MSVDYFKQLKLIIYIICLIEYSITYLKFLFIKIHFMYFNKVMFNQHLYECINQVEFKQIIILFYLMLIYLYLYINVYNSFNDISLVLELIINYMQISA